ncbi:bifunctional 4-hydroxy-2-oxoglutarate aldolase/2-dehydro-3-deoxy-phosphogluconate aldolase [Deinococcus yavapaiensis]|uniref:2-dehydro-3-deoxyphosphogluconate aldolase/(4S)-4-hydroxy-2-oxoglutarate aldolase n=1 Tax=Deinococcus yavapaiensis KR-236 TaxID=694435 RepID=A0A318SG24_9DEIO|nr:bifunctional 4-hydroxy-2-oxoglutarate aldolase/2-dehydro-3-deoxy-phosphogluconate aldolase [Deinococcus yavapaiensis]PYE56334.1 2-dehydro-3-deoxyphosphogluconate aldolase/(4S)-4-hydroxy-2-oxoglutarate aldolase [Deinococcus yavapaiensis KR-236]
MTFLADLRRHKLVAILRGVPPEHAPTLAATLHDAGIRLLEVALNDDVGFEALRAVAASKPEDLILGAGTVVTPDLALRAMDVGATFLVTPHVTPDVNTLAAAHGLGMLCGATTPTEMHLAMSSGATAVKLFPAGPLGPAYLKALFGPYPELPVVVVGNVDERNLADFLKAGAIGAGVGGAITNANWADPDFERLAEHARRLVHLAHGALS